MYNWNKEYIKTLIILFKGLKTEESKEDIKTLKSMIHKTIIDNDIKNNINNDLEDYKKVRQYNYLVNKICEKYNNEEDDNVSFNNIYISKKEMLTFARDNIKKLVLNGVKKLNHIF